MKIDKQAEGSFFYSNDQNPIGSQRQRREQPQQPEDRVLRTAQRAFEHREGFWELAARLSHLFGRPRLQAVIFTEIVQKYLASRNVTFADVLSHADARKFFSSGRLQLASLLAERMRASDGAEGAGEDAFFRRQARALARQHADQGVGLRTALGVRGVEDEAQLRRRALDIMREHHPDRGGAGEEALVQAANALLDLLKRGNLEDYLRVYEDLQRPGRQATPSSSSTS